MVTIKDLQTKQSSLILNNLVNAYEQLERIRPSHSFLSYITIDSDGNVSFLDKYYEKFTKPRDDYGTFGLVRYTGVLEGILK